MQALNFVLLNDTDWMAKTPARRFVA